MEHDDGFADALTVASNAPLSIALVNVLVALTVPCIGMLLYRIVVLLGVL